MVSLGFKKLALAMKNPKKSGSLQKAGLRWTRSVGLGFKTPKEAETVRAPARPCAPPPPLPLPPHPAGALAPRSLRTNPLPLPPPLTPLAHPLPPPPPL